MSQQSVQSGAQPPARIIFAGSPEFAVPPLQSILATQHSVVAVLTQPDRPAGRGRKLRPSPVKEAALAANLPVLQPETLKAADVQQSLDLLDADLMVVVAYGLLLPPEVLQLPRLGCVNLHASLLPRWRGASPIQAAILNGDDRTGVSLMQMDVGLDTGPVYATTALEIAAQETAGELHDRLAMQGAQLLEANLSGLLASTLAARPQPEEGVTYAGIIKKSAGAIDWRQPAIDIERQIRAYNPWPVAYTDYQGATLRCWEAMAETDAPSSKLSPGAVVERSEYGIAVQTDLGILHMQSVQLPGKKRVTAREFCNAHDITNLVLGHN